MDINMPDISGYETTELIIKHLKDKSLPIIPIYALTAYVTDDVLQKCHKAGMKDRLTKPLLKD